MNEFTGGARIGWVNASWPLAKLRVAPNELEVTALLLGTHRFRPEDVLEVAQVTWLPVVAWGVRIRHVRGDVPETVVFWTLGNPKRILEAVRGSGFTPKAPPNAQRIGASFPFRIPFVVVAILLWNGLFLLDRLWQHPPRFIWGPGIFTALVLLFAASVLIRRPGLAQRAALKSPDELPRVRGFLNLLTLVSGFMLVMGTTVAMLVGAGK